MTALEVLTTPCYHSSKREYDACDKCFGTGRKPSAAGTDLIQFLKWYESLHKRRTESFRGAMKVYKKSEGRKV